MTRAFSQFPGRTDRSCPNISSHPVTGLCVSNNTAFSCMVLFPSRVSCWCFHIFVRVPGEAVATLRYPSRIIPRKMILPIENARLFIEDN